MKRIGIVGVGLLGSAVASRLLKEGFDVKGHDTRPEQLKALRALGLNAAKSIAEAAAQADAVFTSVGEEKLKPRTTDLRPWLWSNTLRRLRISTRVRDFRMRGVLW